MCPADRIRNVVLTTSVSRLAGGLYESVRRLHQEMAVLGTEVTVHAGWDRFSDQDGAEWSPLATRVHPAGGVSDVLGYCPRPAMLLRAEEASRVVLHLHGLWRGKSLAAWRTGRRLGVPCVISPRGMLDPWAVRNARWKKRLTGWLFENRNLRDAACLHALCDSEAESIRAYGLKNPIAVIPNGIDVLEQSVQGSQFKVQGLSGQSLKTLLFLGRIHPKKGLRELIEAWKTFRGAGDRRQEAGWKLVVAGWDDGGCLEGLKRQVAELGLAESIHFTGPVYGGEKDALLRRADAFVLPSFSEGLPMAILEAWAYGLPVIMTRECNLPEGARHGAAILTEPRPEALVEALRMLQAMTGAEREAMGGRGRQLAKEAYAWPRLAAQMLEVYGWLLGRRQRPACVRID
jgi:poly(glycerol-phosphate) alpha-glucosyltransferase